MIIYKATNLINGKVYIGQTTKKIRRRMKQHLGLADKGEGFKIHKAIRKYGKDNFNWEIIDTASNLDELKNKEIHWVEYYDSYKNGYNSTLGGDHSWMLGKKHKEETIEKLKKIQQKNQPFKGKHHSEETKQILREIFVLPYEDIVNIFNNENYIVITKKEEYIDVSTKIEVICNNNHKWEVRPYAFKNNQRCPKCHKIKSRLNYNDIVIDFEKSGYKVLTTQCEYEDAKNSGSFKFQVICNNNHKTNILYHNFQQGHRCHDCYLKEKSGKKRGGYKNVDVDKIKSLYEEGNSFYKIATIMDLNCKLVKRRLQFIGVCE